MAEIALPHNDEAERTILGAALIESSVMASAAAILKAGDFYLERHRLIYQALIDLIDAGKGLDLVVLKDHLEGRGELEKCGGAAYLAALLDGVPRMLKGVDSWAQIVKDRAIQRRLIHAAARVQVVVRDAASGAEAVSEAMAAIAAAADETIIGSWQDPPKDIKAGMDLLEAMSRAEDGILGLSTGLRDLDASLGGLKPGELILIGARPAMGKTALALNISDSVAASGQTVGFLSLEMTREQLATRRLCAHARVPSRDVKDRDPRVWAPLAKAVGELMARPFYVDDTFFTTAAQIRAKARRLAMDHGPLALLVVDYLQLVEGAGEENRNQEVSVVSRSLKGLAKELNIPVIALSQLNRGSEKKTRPGLSDLRESGSLEQDADVVLLIHRQDEFDNPEWMGLAEIIVAKQRNGPTGPVKVAFIKEITRFENLTRRPAAA